MSKRIVIIDGHPDPDRERFCHALTEAYVQGARETGNEVRTLTLAETEVPFLRTAQEFSTPPLAKTILAAREDLLWCEHLVLVFPLWLGGAPALVRAFFEQVGRANFIADASGKGIVHKLIGRSGRLIVTLGMPALAYRLVFHEHGIRNIMQGVLGFGGLSPIKRTLFGAIEAVSDEERKRRIDYVHALGRRAA